MVFLKKMYLLPQFIFFAIKIEKKSEKFLIFDAILDIF